MAKETQSIVVIVGSVNSGTVIVAIVEVHEVIGYTRGAVGGIYAGGTERIAGSAYKSGDVGVGGCGTGGAAGEVVVVVPS